MIATTPGRSDLIILIKQELTSHLETRCLSLAEIDTLVFIFSDHKGPGKRGHIVAHDVSWAAQTGKHLLETQNVYEQNQKRFLCPGNKICVRNKCCARGQTGNHLCRQQCVLVCQGLNVHD